MNKHCACCGGPLQKPPIGNWQVVRVSQAHAPSAGAVVIVADRYPECMVEVHVCFGCWTSRLMPLAEMVDRVNCGVEVAS